MMRTILISMAFVGAIRVDASGQNLSESEGTRFPWPPFPDTRPTIDVDVVLKWTELLDLKGIQQRLDGETLEWDKLEWDKLKALFSSGNLSSLPTAPRAFVSTKEVLRGGTSRPLDRIKSNIRKELIRHPLREPAPGYAKPQHPVYWSPFRRAPLGDDVDYRLIINLVSETQGQSAEREAGDPEESPEESKAGDPEESPNESKDAGVLVLDLKLFDSKNKVTHDIERKIVMGQTALEPFFTGMTSQEDLGNLLVKTVKTYAIGEWMNFSSTVLADVWKNVTLASDVAMRSVAASNSVNSIDCTFPFEFQDTWLIPPTTFAVTIRHNVVDDGNSETTSSVYYFVCPDESSTNDGLVKAVADEDRNGSEPDPQPTPTATATERRLADKERRRALFKALERLCTEEEVRIEAGMEVELVGGTSERITDLDVSASPGETPNWHNYFLDSTDKASGPVSPSTTIERAEDASR